MTDAQSVKRKDAKDGQDLSGSQGEELDCNDSYVRLNLPIPTLTCSDPNRPLVTGAANCKLIGFTLVFLNLEQNAPRRLLKHLWMEYHP